MFWCNDPVFENDIYGWYSPRAEHYYEEQIIVLTRTVNNELFI